MSARRLGLPLWLLPAAAALASCVAGGFERMQEEFVEIRVNCGLSGTILERDARDKRLLRLVFRQRHNAALQARGDGSLACAEHWARERGYRLTTTGGEGR